MSALRLQPDSASARAITTVTAGDVHVELLGMGEPVLLLHGIGSDARGFRYQLEDLSDEFTLVAWDAPGYGRSSDPPAALRLHDFAAAAVEVMRGLRMPRFHIVGASWGGLVALQTVLDAPECVNSLTLIGSTPGRRGNADAIANLAERVERIRSLGPAEYARQRSGTVLGPKTSDELRATIETIGREAVRLPGYEYAARSLANADIRPLLSRVTAPTLVLVGDEDQVTGTSESEELLAGLADARLVTVPEAGHLVNQEAPSAVNAELRRHLRASTSARKEVSS